MFCRNGRRTASSGNRMPPRCSTAWNRRLSLLRRRFVGWDFRLGHYPNLYSFAFGRYLRIMTCSVLLDLDGTLIDSHPGILASCLAALRALGHEPDESLDVRRTIGPPLEDMMQILLQSYGDDRVGEAVAAYRQHYGESGFLGSVPYPGIGKSLEEMKRTGLRLYLATSKKGALRKPHSGQSEVCHILRWHLWLSAERRTGSQA